MLFLLFAAKTRHAISFANAHRSQRAAIFAEEEDEDDVDDDDDDDDDFDADDDFDEDDDFDDFDADEDEDELSIKECPPKAAPTSVQSKSVLNISSVWFTGNSKMASVWTNRSFSSRTIVNPRVSSIQLYSICIYSNNSGKFSRTIKSFE